jgi:hypothetical protein
MNSRDDNRVFRLGQKSDSESDIGDDDDVRPIKWEETPEPWLPRVGHQANHVEPGQAVPPMRVSLCPCQTDDGSERKRGPAPSSPYKARRSGRERTREHPTARRGGGKPTWTRIDGGLSPIN